MHDECVAKFLELPYRLQYGIAMRAFLTEDGDLEMTDEQFAAVIFNRVKVRGMVERFCDAVSEVHAGWKQRRKAYRLPPLE